MEVYNSVNEQLLSQTKQSVLLDKIEFKLNENENNLNDNKLLKQQYNFLKPDQKQQNSERCNGMPPSPVKQFNGIKSGKNNDSTSQPKYTICSSSAIQLEWKHSKNIGAGFINLGNTCFMNSVLQALTYCPPLVNYLLYTNNDHINKCKVVGLCMTCELTKHIKNSYANSGSVIRPQTIFSRLKQLARHFQPGRQEDSHEFLRYVIDNIWKSCIINWESSHGIKLDARSKETTFINQIFGGYHRSQITCLSCKAKSDTYDYFMDFILDIKSVASLERALEVYNQPEILRNENAYKCSNCNKKVAAEKTFTVDRAPNVATFQFKRFDYNRIFGGKITKQISYPEILNLRPYMSESKGDPINYKLFAVLVHLGSTSNSGHYFCYVRNSNQNWYLMDDARVSSTSLNQVLDQQAYMLFYVRIPNKENNLNRNDSFNRSITNSSEKVLLNNGSKLLITNLKPNGLIHKENNSLPKIEIRKQNNNLPKLICDDVNTKQNGEVKLVNNNRLSMLSEIDKKLNNLGNSNTNKSLTSLSSKKSEEKKDKSILVKKRPIVPYDNNSSDDEEDDNSSMNKKQKFENSEDKCNGILKEGSSLLKKTDSNKVRIKKDEDSIDEKNKKSKEHETIDECKNKELIEGITKHLEDHIQSNNEKDKKQLLNGFAKFAESIGSLYGEDDILKQIETMSKEKIEFTPEMKQQFNQKDSNSLNKTPTKSTPQKLPNNSQESRSLLIKAPTPLLKNDDNQHVPIKNVLNGNNRTYSPVKMNGFLSNNYYQSKQASGNQLNNINLHLSKLPSTENTWIVGQSPSKCKTSSIASGSSTNSINSTTEWQVIDRDTKSSKKNQKHHILDNSWKVVDPKSHSSSEDSDNEKSGKVPDKKQKLNDKNDSDNERTNRSLSSQLKKDELTEIERRFKKKLKKIEKKDFKRYEKLKSDPDAMLSLYVKMKRKFNRRKDKHYSSDHRRDDHASDKEKKHKRSNRNQKKEHFRNNSPNNSFHNCNNKSSDEQLNMTDQSSNQSFEKNDKVISPQKKNNLLGQKFNEVFNNVKKKDVKNELNEMHLNLLGKNVNTWTGKKTQIDKEVKEDLEKNKKKNKDDLYNEEYDRGKVKKIKIKSDDDKNRSKENPFQKVYERQYINTPDKSKFIKSI